MSEQQRILEMIEKGQLTAAEAMELLEALNTTKEVATIQEVILSPKHNYKFFRIKVTSDNNSVNVNVNIPIGLLTTIGEIADKMTTMIPPDAKKDMEAKGIDISTIDFAKIIEEVINGTLDEPNIIEVEAWDESSQSMIKVRVYVD
ncbi:SHOCT-like domain-containing protein [Acetobacterium woodii]|uniref:YvlB/LiaX N-terminal domain-containing protein n=1 Tax=Acetobacterium woodii (strain ATCC 29683 / DSM 1030 / JCM 2381 / KCTC 1655 / WB1) TaxID=931626 RepID=H6LKZ6_ACEWD|nr:hypothetical protein [Acetobacterium woodii]AFA50105.1 hypothetical protein Awo_c33770 [Acetobacterium woodii DSM 1030]